MKYRQIKVVLSLLASGFDAVPLSWLEKGVDLRYIQDLLGHESSKTTEIYTHNLFRYSRNHEKRMGQTAQPH